MMTGSLGGGKVVRSDRLRAVTDIHQVKGQIDYLLVTVKDKNMDETLLSVKDMHDQIKAVFSFQNGITHEDKLAEVFGWEKVIGGVTIEGADMPGPGVIDYTLASTTYFGEFDGSMTERVNALAEIFRRGGMSSEAIPNIKSAKCTMQHISMYGESGLSDGFW